MPVDGRVCGVSPEYQGGCLGLGSWADCLHSLSLCFSVFFESLFFDFCSHLK